MKMNMKKVSLAVLQALSAGVVVSLAATAVQAQQVQKIEKIDVTGSNIRRVDVEGPAPVEIITREDIAKTGARTLNELLLYIPSIDKYNQGEIASNSPSGSGTAMIRMRGLSENNTLVLLNGRRLPVNALYDASGAGAAVDINMIPASAIERVEILKDGGSAIYGADAIAGVVNFITRKDFTGGEVSGSFGESSRRDGKESGVNLAAGFGNLDKDRYNVLVALDHFKRDPIYRKDREISSSVDFRRYGFGDGRSSFAPQGNYVDPNTGAYNGQSVVPCPPALFNGRCRYDFNASLLTAYNGADRTSGMVIGNVKINADLKAFAHLSYAETKDHFEAHPVPDYFVVPSGTGLIAGRFMQGGPRITDRKSTLFDTTAGLEGSTKLFDWDVALGHGESKVTNSDKNYYNADLWNAATGSGALDPTVSTNDQAFVDSLKVSPVRKGISKLDFVDLKARGDAFSLPAGRVGWAVGGSWWKDHLTDTPDALTQQGLVVGSIQQSAVDASRAAKAVFAEVSVPVLKGVEMQGAIRYDSYPNNSKTSPKVGVLWKASKDVSFRASYSESFRVPSLKQLYGAQEQGAGDITEDQDCLLIGQPVGCNVAFFQVQGANAKLKPEKGKTYNLGTVVDLGAFSGTLDYWRIEKDDAITTPTITSALQQGLFSRDPVLGRLFVFTNLQNVAQGLNEGIDADFRVRIPSTAVGTVTIRNVATYYLKQRTREKGADEWSEFNGTYATPRWKTTLIFGIETGPWGFNLSDRVTAGFTDTPNPWTASAPLPLTIRQVAIGEEWDLTGSYTGIKNLRIDGGIKNLTDRTPPFSQTNALNNQYEQVGFAPLYSSRGRFFFAGVTYTFK
jgi:iron complex outermembrane receptor protein